MNFGEAGETFLDIPVVENLKILGRYLGKSQIVCDYQNFYSKIAKIEKVLNLWKQCKLTILGRSLLINSLSLSSFTFN